VLCHRSSAATAEERGGEVLSSLALLHLVIQVRYLIELRLEKFVSLLSHCPLDELTGLSTVTANEALRFDAGLPVLGHDDFDGLVQTVPPT